jgi:hypothetical protein
MFRGTESNPMTCPPGIVLLIGVAFVRQATTGSLGLGADPKGGAR